MGGLLRVLLVIGLICGPCADLGAVEEQQLSLQVTSPRESRSSTSLPLIEVRGRAGSRRSHGHDLVMVLDLSDSTVLSSGMDLDGDGPPGGTDPEFLAWLSEQPGVRSALVERLREVDLEDSVLMAEVAAAEVLIQRLDLRVFRIGIVVFSDTARVAAPLGSPRGRLNEALQEIRHGFFEDLRGTNFGDAIRLAHAELMPEPDDGSDRRALREDRERSILFLSDGAPTLPVHAHRAEDHALREARAAALDGIRIYSFALGREAEEALEVYRRMAILSGGRFEKIDRPGDAIARLRRVDLADLEELGVVNRSNGRPVRALRVFPDGSFDGFVELAPGRNLVVFTATARDGTVVSVARDVTYLREAGGDAEGVGPDAERARELLEELRRRTRETALWAEIERGRNVHHRLEVEIAPEPPGGR